MCKRHVWFFCNNCISLDLVIEEYVKPQQRPMINDINIGNTSVSSIGRLVKLLNAVRHLRVQGPIVSD